MGHNWPSWVEVYLMKTGVFLSYVRWLRCNGSTLAGARCETHLLETSRWLTTQTKCGAEKLLTKVNPGSAWSSGSPPFSQTILSAFIKNLSRSTPTKSKTSARWRKSLSQKRNAPFIEHWSQQKKRKRQQTAQQNKRVITKKKARFRATNRLLLGVSCIALSRLKIP